MSAFGLLDQPVAHHRSGAYLVHEVVVVASSVGCLLVEFALFGIATSTNFGVHFAVIIHLLMYLLAVVGDNFDSCLLADSLYPLVLAVKTIVLLLQTVILLQD